MNEKKQSELGRIRSEIDDVNGRLLELLNERARLVQQIGPVKQAAGHRLYDPVREAEQLQRLMLLNRGPMSNAMVERIFRAVFQAFLSQQMEAVESGAPLVMEHTGTTRGVAVGGLAIGGGKPVVIAGPCAIEDEESLDAVAAALSAHGVRFLRGGAFKPRKSPYTFQ
jgi:3-deoxy-7-phosphoheptulonate synthase/chorismate mutase